MMDRQALLSLVPDTHRFQSLEDWARGGMAATGLNGRDFSLALGLSNTTVYYWLKHPDKGLTPHTQRTIIEALPAVTLAELERLRPSKHKWEEQHKKTGQTTRERHGDKFIKERGRRGVQTRMTRYSAQERSAFSSVGGRAAAEKSRGKPRDPVVIRRIRESRIGKPGKGRGARRRAIGEKSRASKTAEGTALQARNWRVTMEDAERRQRWGASKVLAGQKRRAAHAELWGLIRETYQRTGSVRAVQRAIEDEGKGWTPTRRAPWGTVARILGELGLRKMPNGYATPADVRAARRIVGGSVGAAGRAVATVHRRQRAEERIAMAFQALVEEGKEPTLTAIRRRSGCRRDAVKRFLLKKQGGTV
jgi:hypothetical protein